MTCATCSMQRGRCEIRNNHRRRRAIRRRHFSRQCRGHLVRRLIGNALKYRGLTVSGQWEAQRKWRQERRDKSPAATIPTALPILRIPARAREMLLFAERLTLSTAPPNGPAAHRSPSRMSIHWIRKRTKAATRWMTAGLEHRAERTDSETTRMGWDGRGRLTCGNGSTDGRR